MSRADELRAQLEAELVVVELEDQLVAAKETGADLSDLKAELREARRDFRLRREGAAAANPATVEVAADVEG